MFSHTIEFINSLVFGALYFILLICFIFAVLTFSFGIVKGAMEEYKKRWSKKDV